MTFIISGIIALFLAIVIGAYRQYCTYMEVKESWNIPRIWRRSLTFRIFSWIFVTGSAIWGAFIVAGMLVSFNDFIGKFLFGVLLLIRWCISAYIGITKAKRAVADFELQDQTEIIFEGDGAKQEPL
jgi:hypothetical protein